MVWNTLFRFNGAQSHTCLDVPSVCEYRWLRPSACICTHAVFIIISCFICNTYFQILVALKSLYQQIEPLELPLIIYPAVNTLTTAWKTQIGRTVTTLTKFLDNMMSSGLGLSSAEHHDIWEAYHTFSSRQKYLYNNCRLGPNSLRLSTVHILTC